MKGTTCNDEVGSCNSMYHFGRWKRQLKGAIVFFVSTTVTTSLQCQQGDRSDYNTPSIYRLDVELILAVFTSGCEDVGPEDVGPENVGPEDVGPEDVGPEGVNALQSRLKSLMAWTVPRIESSCICTNNRWSR